MAHWSPEKKELTLHTQLPSLSMNLITEFLAGMLLILVYICGQQMNDNGMPNVHFDVNMFREQTKKRQSDKTKYEWMTSTIPLIHRILIKVPTLFTYSPREALRAGAFECASVWDRCADASILTRVRLTRICDSAWSVDKNWNQNIKT